MSENTINVKLYELNLTKEENTYSGKVQLNGRATNRRIAERIVQERTEYRLETIIAIADLIDHTKIAFLTEGCTVSDGVCHMTPVVSGKFTGKEAKWDAKDHGLSVAISPSSTVRKTFAGKTVVTLGAAQTGPVINSVTDTLTKEQNVITIGWPLFLHGSRIKICGEEGDGTGIVFINITESGDRIRIPLEPKGIIINNPSSLQIKPPALEPGDWQIELTTRFSQGRRQLRKEACTCRFEQMLTVI